MCPNARRMVRFSGCERFAPDVVRSRCLLRVSAERRGIHFEDRRPIRAARGAPCDFDSGCAGPIKLCTIVFRTGRRGDRSLPADAVARLAGAGVEGRGVPRDRRVVDCPACAQRRYERCICGAGDRTCTHGVRAPGTAARTLFDWRVVWKWVGAGCRHRVRGGRDLSGQRLVCSPVYGCRGNFVVVVRPCDRLQVA